MDAFGGDFSLENSELAAVETIQDVEVSAEAPPLSTEESMNTAVVLQEGIYIEPVVDHVSVVDPSEYKAATRVQKVYRSYRTRRRLADTAIVAEELWWQAQDFCRLNRSTISFFNYATPETAISRWNRVTINASKVGQGLSKDGKALKLAFQHWIEAIDPRHRYGHNLHFYYDKWCESDADQPFFYWLDIGEGKNVDLEECPRSLLRKQCIKYLGPYEREHYEYIQVKGRITHKKTGDLLDTTNGPEGTKWIFVMSTSRRLYAGMKKKGMFQHSSFLAGGSTIAAGRFTAENGVLKTIWAYSGHYKPSDENLNLFLNHLREHGVNLDEVEVRSSESEDYSDYGSTQSRAHTGKLGHDTAQALKPPPLQIPTLDQPVYQRTFSGTLQSPKAQVSEREILDRIKAKWDSSSYQLGEQVSSKWCSGVGPRIGCVADYPAELRLQALEFTNLSPRRLPTPHSSLHSSFLSSLPSPVPQVSS